MQSTRTVRLILGDQLNQRHSWFSESCPHCLYVMMEIRQETDYVDHHIQKVMGIFGAMRRFAENLKSRGHRVHYLHLSDESNRQDFRRNITEVIKQYEAEEFQYQLPDEYRLDQQLKEICHELKEEGITCSSVDTEHFLCKRDDLAEFFKGKKTYLMESFYRDLRKKHGILMKGSDPEGGKWNYDKQNRESLPKGHRPAEPLVFDHNLTDLYEEIKEAGVKTIGEVDAERYLWPLDRSECLELLDYFAENALPWFGQFQDALTQDSWSVYHSRLSFAMNIKLLSPKEVIQRVIDQWRNHKEEIDIAQVEGYVRQILGWREYMRGVYWAHMPGYASENFFDHDTPLPSWFWTGETKMTCMRHAIKQSLQYSYAHHIQRLMVTGNFALLAGIDPDEVDKWYLGIYIDAFEWVEITNTRGMSQFADGGIVGTKPYVSSANYIDKMGHYCNGCYYDKKDKTGDKACPFNSLYWHFYDRNRDKLSNNPRVGMMYRTWDRMKDVSKKGILERADEILKDLEGI